MPTLEQARVSGVVLPTLEEYLLAYPSEGKSAQYDPSRGYQVVCRLLQDGVSQRGQQEIKKGDPFGPFLNRINTADWSSGEDPWMILGSLKEGVPNSSLSATYAPITLPVKRGTTKLIGHQLSVHFSIPEEGDDVGLEQIWTYSTFVDGREPVSDYISEVLGEVSPEP